MPNPMKSQIKMGTIQEMGAAMDDVLEAAEKDIRRAEGAKKWLQDAVRGVRSIIEKVESDFEEGKIGEGWNQLQILEYTKKTLAMVSQSMQDLALNAESVRLNAEGRADSARRCVTIAKKKYDDEKRKLQAALAQLEATETDEDTGEDRPSIRPRSTDAAEDLAKRKEESRKVKSEHVVAEKTSSSSKKTTKKKASAKKKTTKK